MASTNRNNMNKSIHFLLIPHNFLIIMGFIFYLMIPLGIGLLGAFKDFPGMLNWHNDFSNASRNIDLYFISIFFLLFSYLLGSKLGSYMLLHRQRKVKILFLDNQDNKALFMISTFILVLSVYLFLSNLDNSFTGYESYNTDLLGSFATISMFSLFFAIYSSAKYSKIFFIATLVISNIFLVSMGTRMYVTIPFISYLLFIVYYSSTKVSKSEISLIIIIAILSLVLVATWRINGDYDIKFMLYIFFAEPTFTWWSVSTYLSNDIFSIFNNPRNFIESFLNFIPTFIFPEKSSYISDPREILNYSAPLGADSLYVSIFGNFGFIGGLFYIFLFGFYNSRIYFYSLKNKFFQSYYICICSILPFQLFRDNFSIINKQLYWNTLFIPMIILVSIYFTKVIGTHSIGVKYDLKI